MPDIKTRDVVKGTVKVIDKSAVAAERMKDAYVRTKDKAEHGIFCSGILSRRIRCRPHFDRDGNGGTRSCSWIR